MSSHDQKDDRAGCVSYCGIAIARVVMSCALYFGVSITSPTVAILISCNPMAVTGVLINTIYQWVSFVYHRLGILSLLNGMTR